MSRGSTGYWVWYSFIHAFIHSFMPRGAGFRTPCWVSVSPPPPRKGMAQVYPPWKGGLYWRYAAEVLSDCTVGHSLGSHTLNITSRRRMAPGVYLGDPAKMGTPRETSRTHMSPSYRTPSISYQFLNGHRDIGKQDAPSTFLMFGSAFVLDAAAEISCADGRTVGGCRGLLGVVVRCCALLLGVVQFC